MNISAAVAVLALCACLAACGWSKKKIDGQVFLTTDAGNAVRLSLIDVYVLDRATAANVLHQMQHQRDEYTATLKRLVEKAEESQKKFREEATPRLVQQQHLWQVYETAQERMRQAYALMEAVPDTRLGEDMDAIGARLKTLAAVKKETEAAKEDSDKAFSEIRLSKDEIKEGFAKQEELERVLNSSNDRKRQVRNLSIYANGLEWKNIKPVSKTTTDVDGKFVINIADKDVVLFSFSNRKINGTTQTYCWLVTPSQTDQLIMLTNKNTIDSSAPENFAAPK